MYVEFEESYMECPIKREMKSVLPFVSIVCDSEHKYQE